MRASSQRSSRAPGPKTRFSEADPAISTTVTVSSGCGRMPQTPSQATVAHRQKCCAQLADVFTFGSAVGGHDVLLPYHHLSALERTKVSSFCDFHPENGSTTMGQVSSSRFGGDP